MRPLFTICCTGLFISFMGTLPLGTLNVLAARMAVDEGLSPAIWFSLGTLLVEMCYVRVSLVAMDRIRRWKKWMRILEALTLIMIVLLAFSSFRAAARPGLSGNVVTGFLSPAPIPRLLAGMLLSAINPLQIPFWFGWSTLLFRRNVLLPRNDHYNIYMLGIGLGTFAGNAVFIFGGRLFVQTLSMHQSLVNGIIGAIFLATAILQIVKLLNPRPSICRGRPD